jgi:D-glycero-alpha-D-manno-heptose-7-phosphate kinase
MIITRAPFRISLGGGGTDLPFYSEKKGGCLITAAIDRYIYVTINRRLFDKLIWLSYSEQETKENIDSVQHSLIREALRFANITSSVEIHSITELCDRAGLGGSSAFLNALLHALYVYKGKNASKNELAFDTTHIERVILQESGGIQDQYVTSYGGFCYIETNSLKDVKVEKLELKESTIDKLSQNLMLFYTGVKRSSSAVVDSQKKENGESEIVNFYDKIKEIGLVAKQALLEDELYRFGCTFHDHWMLKREFTQKMSNDNFDKIYDVAMQNGALGGKIVGAGGGGFFLFYVPVGHEKFCEKMKEEKLHKVEFNFDFEGTTTVLNKEIDRSVY